MKYKLSKSLLYLHYCDYYYLNSKYQIHIFEFLDIKSIDTLQNGSECFQGETHMSQVQITGFINGEFLPPSDQIQPVYDPGNSTQQIGTISNTSLDDVNKAIEAAHEAFQTWKDTPIAERQELLKKHLSSFFKKKII